MQTELGVPTTPDVEGVHSDTLLPLIPARIFKTIINLKYNVLSDFNLEC